MVITAVNQQPLHSELHMNLSPLSRLTIAGVAIALTSACSMFSTQSSSAPSLRQNTTTTTTYDDDRIKRHFYAGIGIGPSRTDPDTSQVPGIDVNERVDNGGQLTLGVDLSRQLSLELHTTDLGSAGLNNDSRINYNIHGGSALFYVGKNRHNFKRRGFSGYGRLGYAFLQNSAEGNVDFEKVNATHFLFGAGLEYMTRIGLGLRLEGIAFDEDARYAQLGLIYRTGKRSRTRQIVQAPVAPEPVVIAPVPAIVTPEVVYEPEPVFVDNTCSDFSGTLEGVGFHTDSANLTDQAQAILDNVAFRLAECPTTPVAISAHTDSVGDDDYNQNLSRERAKSVLRFLVNRGIDISRVQARAFGESRPIDTNDTAEGRKRNRRVELFAQ